MDQKIAVLIVNGGDSPKHNRWLDLCLEKLRSSLAITPFQLYLWNNNLNDPALKSRLLNLPWVTYLEAAIYEKLHHPHRTPLQRLYTLAREQGAEIIVTLDSDAHPLQPDWLTQLVTALENGAVLAGVWRAEMVPAIRPHIHPSCLCTTVDFIEQYQLRFDFDNTHSREKTDTLAHFTWVAEAAGLPVYKLKRSNQRQFHYWMGGIYGDLVYHHVAASRERVLFYNTPIRDRFQIDAHQKLRNATGELLFSNYDMYLGWLQGKEVTPRFQREMERLCALAKSERTPKWWLDRASSPELYQTLAKKIQTGIKAKVLSNPLAARLKGKADRVAGRLRPRLYRDVRNSTPAPLNAMSAPFAQGQFYPLPSYGWTTKAPDFVGIGSPKSGTSFFYHLLLQHPQIVEPRIRFANPKRKETQYFLHFQHRNLPEDVIETYCAAFASPPGVICGEFSVQYLAYPNCLEHLALAAPKTKIVLILRNPIDRFISHLNHLITKRGRHLFGNITEKQRYILHNFSFYSEAALHSLYSVGLTRPGRTHLNWREREKGGK